MSLDLDLMGRILVVTSWQSEICNYWSYLLVRFDMQGSRPCLNLAGERAAPHLYPGESSELYSLSTLPGGPVNESVVGYMYFRN